MTLLKKFLLLGALVSICASVFTQAFGNETLRQATKFISTNQFQEAINVLEATGGIKGKELHQKNYLMAIAYSRLGQFPKAIELFTTLEAVKLDAVDFWYEYGQALYANNNLNKSRGAFLKSIEKNFKLDVSNYYVAHISQLLEQYDVAKKHYMEIIKDKSAQENMKQIAHFQLGEVHASIAEQHENARELVKTNTIPNLEKAIALGPKSPVVADINRRMKELKAKYRLDPNLFVNGRPIPQKRYVAQVTQKVTYDNNMTLATDLPSKQASKKDSFAFKSSADLNYNFYYEQQYGINPGVVYAWSRHSERDSSEVYTNDGWDLNMFLRTKNEHEFKGKQASFSFNLDYDYSAKDRLAKDENIFFSRAISFSIGESLSYFSFGPSAITLKRRISKGFAQTADNNTNSLTVMQTFLKKNADLMILLFVASQTRLEFAPNSDTNSYLFSFSYIVPEIWPRFILNAGLNLTLLDTMAQKTTRGTEKTWSPSIKLTRKSGERLRATIFYNHTINQSLDTASYDYNKQQYGFEVNYLF